MRHLLVTAVLLASAAGHAAEDVPPDATPLVEALDAEGTYLVANARDEDGTPAFVHVTPDDMPLRVAISLPRVPAKDGNRAAAREAAIQGMMLWEAALAPTLPWFRLAFVEEDESAPVQVVWKRRMTGDAAGRGWMLWETEAGRLRVGGRMHVTMQPALPVETPLELDEVKLLLAHEFGHVLGLGHCLACDSAMNYSWHTRERILVTEIDVATFRALVARPNGTRVDGKPLAGLATTAGP